MCGISGIAGDVDNKLKEAFLDLFLITQVRGKDSSGAFSVNHADKTTYMKGLGTPELLIDRKSFDKTVMTGFPKVMAAHCRSKTVGDNTPENAHPYDFDNVIGMHNGTLREYYHLEGYDYKSTDSHLLYGLIDKYGIEEAMRKISPTSHYALVWWDKVDNTLNFLRNEHRPLWFAWTKDKKSMIWASEPGMFWAVNRRVELWDGSPEKEGDEPRSPYFQLPVNQLWSFSVSHVHLKDKPSMTLHPVREILAEGRKPGNVHVGSRSNPHWVNGKYVGPHGGGEVVRPFVVTKEATEDPLDDPLPQLPALITGPPRVESSPEGSTTTKQAGTTSETPSAKILDFRPDSMRSKNSQRPMLSLRQRISNGTLRKDNDDSSKKSKPSALRPSHRRVSFRTLLGERYVSSLDTNREVPLKTFLADTKGECTFCHQGLTEDNLYAMVTAKKGLCIDCVTSEAQATVG